MTRALISFGILVLSIIILIQFVIPRFSTVQDLRHQGDQLRQTLADAEDTREKWQATLSRYNAIGTEDLERLDAMIPGTDDPFSLIVELDALAEQYDLELMNVEALYPPDGEISQNVYEQYQVSVSIHGAYLPMTEFVERLERNLRIVDMTGFSFDAGRVRGIGELTAADLEEKENSDYTITFNTYWLPS